MNIQSVKYWCKYNFPYRFRKTQSIAAGAGRRLCLLLAYATYIFRKTGSNICSTSKCITSALILLPKCFNRMIDRICRRESKLPASGKGPAAAEEKLQQQYSDAKRAQQILKASEERIKRLAYTDSLTGLANREKLVETLAEALENAGDEASGGAVMYIDLDNFKSINDTMGHTIGDKVLIEIAHKFLKVDYQNKTVARIGGDEFILLVNGPDYSQKVMDVCNSIVKIFEKPVVVDAKSFNVTTSIGVVLYPAHGSTAEELMKKADLAMYRAKQCGKNCYRIFDESMELEIITRVNIENGLRNALTKNELVLHYQPQYCLHTGRILCLEALLRWNSPTLGQVSPLRFIKVAEETGMIVNIEKWVLKNACIFAKSLNERMHEAMKISVNISSVHIMQSEFVNNVMSIIKEVGVYPGLIGLEITETVMMESFDSNKNKLEELKKLGMEIHLDDFGSGYSSLNYLQNLPIDYVKIDKAFIDTLLNSERNGKITETVIGLAHYIGLRVVAEGVESEEQYNLLKQYQCDLVQGYYISKPLSMEAAVEFLVTVQGASMTVKYRPLSHEEWQMY